MENTEDSSSAPLALGNSTNNFIDSSRASTLLLGFSLLYKNKQFVDVTLKVDNTSYPCHKNVLSCSSPYFMAMFSNECSESLSNEVSIKDITPQTMELILDYIYTGQVKLSEDTVQQLLSAANHFLLVPLRTGCADFMLKHVTVSNCIGVHFFAKAHECEVLADKAKQIINSQFISLCKEQEFLSLPADKLIEIVSDSQVHVPSEEVIFEACLSWVMFDYDQRKKNLEKVMACVRFASMSSYYFCDKVDNCQLFKSCANLRRSLDSVRYYHMLKNRVHEMDLNLVPRKGMSYRQAVYILANPYCEETQNRYNSMEALLPYDSTVTTVCKLPLSLYMPGCTITGDNQLYLAGGAIRKINNRGSITTEGISCNTYIYEQTSNSWTTKARLIQARYQFSLTLVDSYLYAVGGQDGSQIFNSVERYDTSQNTWTMITTMPKALSCLSAISYKGILYVIGGETSTEITQTAYRYDPCSDEWTLLPDMKFPRALTGVVIYQDCIYVVGGNSAISEKWKKEFLPEQCVDSVEIFDPETNTWSEGPALPNALCGAGVVKYGDSILVVGGEDENSWMAGLFTLRMGEDGVPVWVEGPELPAVMSTFGCVIANVSSDIFQPSTP